MSGSEPVPAAQRFAFIDGLRGFAALGIALYHIWRYEPRPYPTLQFVPAIVDWLLVRTWIGVQVLLVVSGFVIAYSMRNLRVTPREIFNFIGRRIVRLAPPYWCALLIVILFHAACSHRQWPLPFDEPLTPMRLLAHLVFLQDVLGESPLSAGIWTICIEIQFYVVAVVSLGLVQAISTMFVRRETSERSADSLGSPSPSRLLPPLPHSQYGMLMLLTPLAFASLSHWSRLDHTEPWVTHFFGTFFLGMMTWWTLDGSVSSRAYFVILAGVVAQLALSWKLEQAIALTTAVAIFVAGRTGHLHDWLNWRWLQHLAKVSYSLYLVHYPVSHLLMWFGWNYFDKTPTPAQATLILTGCLAASLGAAQLVYVAAERPSVRLANRLKTQR